jgi:hypothetical protein
MRQTFTHRRLAGLTIVLGAVLLGSAPPVAADQGAPTSTKTRAVERGPQPAPHVVDVRTGQHATFDRVVIDLKGGAPGYRIGYVREVREDGSGKVVDTRGRANLLVRLTPANAHHENGSPTYNGPSRFDVDYPALREVAFAGDFEATVAIALGIRHKNGFRVMTLHDPTRIVVDIAH